MRTNADYAATKLINEHLYTIADKDSFLKYLVTMNTDVKAIADKSSSISFTKKFLNCTKIKFLRKAMIKKDFGITNDEYEKILTHPKFMVK